MLEQIKIHDKFQIEIKEAYFRKKNKKDTIYKIETYIFIPNSLDINRHTYSKDDFYNDLKTYIRFKIPMFALKNFMQADNNPYEKLKIALKNLSASVNRENIRAFEFNLKMFASILKSSMRDQVNYILKQKEVIIPDLLDEFVNTLTNILKAFRVLRKIIMHPGVREDIISKFDFTDEYISLITEKYSFKIADSIGTQVSNDIKKSILRLVKAEITYRKEQGYPSIPDENTPNEIYLYRRNVLKKYISSSLFLNTKISNEGLLTEQIFFSIAAGIAMIFATTMAFIARYKYGTITIQVFLILVISYMFKDRIKELLRMFFSGIIRKYFYDYRVKIKKGRYLIGFAKESFNFVKEKNIPSEILKYRSRDRITDTENENLGEKVIFFKKYIKIYSNKLKHYYKNYNIESIIDITRLNFDSFVKKADNPEKKIFILTGNETYKTLLGRRVYHINIILKYINPDGILYTRFRIIFNKTGIRRIEEVKL